MESFARRLLRASHVIHGFGAALILFGLAVNGYWALFFPFLAGVGVWVWLRRRHPDFR